MCAKSRETADCDSPPPFRGQTYTVPAPTVIDAYGRTLRKAKLTASEESDLRRAKLSGVLSQLGEVRMPEKSREIAVCETPRNFTLNCWRTALV